MYKYDIQKYTNEWKSLKINKLQTFEDQCLQKRRPRITWDMLYSQIKTYYELVFNGYFKDIFNKV